MCRWIEQNCILGEGDFFGQPVRLRPWQKRIIYRLYEVRPDGSRRYRRALVGFPKGNGKALALDTPIATVDGWSTMGDLAVGDRIFDEHGDVCSVTAAHPIMLGNRCFKVTFSDGSTIVADAEHLWLTEELRHEYKSSLKTTAEIAATVVVRADGARNHRIPVAGALNLPEASLPLDPYTLGVWLGDGDSDQGRITQHPSDASEVLERFNKADIAWRFQKPHRNGCLRISLLGWGVELRRLGLLGNKHIPAEYMRASRDQRLELLRGLLDTDGSCSRGAVEFCVTNERLAFDFLELALTLSLKPVLAESTASVNGKDCGKRYRVTFNGPCDFAVFHLTRKAEKQRLKPSGSQMSKTRRIVAVEPIESVPVRCIAVDSPSSLYLAGPNLVATHNTPFAAWICNAELGGPVVFDRWGKNGQAIGKRRHSPVVPVGAASFDQADLVFAEMKTTWSESPTLKGFAEVFDTEILLKGEEGRAYRIAAARATNDGGRPSCFVADELHEWNTRASAGAHLVMANGTAKRADSLQLAVTTAGSDLDTLLGRMYLKGRRVEAGDEADDEFFFEWWEAPEGCDVTDDDTLKAAIRLASPAADDFVRVNDVVAQFRQIPEFEARRYFLNQWTHAADSWLPPGAWDDCEGDADIPLGSTVFVGVDMALRHDSIAVATVFPDDSGHFRVQAKVWRPDGNKVDVAAVDNYLRELHRNFNVVDFAYDPAYYERSAQALEDEGLPMTEFTQNASYMVPACQIAYETIVQGQLVHNGDPTLQDHVLSAAQREGERGWTLSKGKSKRKIDACIAMILALYRAVQRQETQIVNEPFGFWG